MVLTPVLCPHCRSDRVIKGGTTKAGKQRYRCYHADCSHYSFYWGAYTRHLKADEHHPGKRHTQQIERKHLTLRTRIKRLAHKTICFSKSIAMHDIVIGLFVNRYEFGVSV